MLILNSVKIPLSIGQPSHTHTKSYKLFQATTITTQAQV